jgi:hypothetical protein
MDRCGNQMKKDKKFEMIEILENATIIYEDGKREIFEAFFLTEYGEIIFGHLLAYENTDLCKSVNGVDCQDIFMECGGIPKDNIKSIEGGNKKNVLIIKRGN